MNLQDLATALWLVVTVAAIVSAVWLVISFRRFDARMRRILEQRLMRGEIDVEDYRRRVAILGR